MPTDTAPGAPVEAPYSVDEILALLRHVDDPEVGVNIVDLGLVYGVDVCPRQGVHVRMTMTSAACPMSEMLVDEVAGTLEMALPLDTPVEVELVWEPPWSPERMSPQARKILGWQYGAR